MIRHQRGLGSLGMQVPHSQCCVVARGALLRVVSEAELGEKAAALTDAVVLVARPERLDPQRVWRRAFHGLVHHALEERGREGQLGPAAVRRRIDGIGQTEFDEVCAVLEAEELLFPGHDDRDAYIELAAFWLELACFEPATLADLFEHADGVQRIEAALQADVDVDVLLAASRPAGARDLAARVTDPPRARTSVPPAAPISKRPSGAPRRSRASASGPHGLGRNVVRAIIARRSAGEDATAQIDDLADRLVAALGTAEGAPDASDWSRVLDALAEGAVRSGILRGVERRVLHDLQKVCVDAERAHFAVDAVTWATSLFRRPLVRALPAVGVVRVARHLAHAYEASHRAQHVDKSERRHLERTFQAASRLARENMRGVIRPALESALVEVGLAPKSVPERVAREKLAEELLDLVLIRRALGLSQLRDAVSRNSLKLPNLAPSQIMGGDPLLRLDRLLAVRLDGVYRPGEIYLRFLQRVSSVAFGTPAGRFLTLYLVLPVLASFVLLEGVQHLLHPLARALHHRHLRILRPPSFTLLALYFFGVLHSDRVRDASRAFFAALGSALHAVFVGFPQLVIRSALVQTVLRVRATSVVVRPAVLGLVVYGIARWLDVGPTPALLGSAGLSVLMMTFLGTPLGLRVDETVTDFVLTRLHDLSRHVLPGLVALVLDVFRTFVELTERGIGTVDEWLTFQDGQSTASRVTKGALGAVWFFVTYLIRIYVNVLIEPQVNPIKHFPVVTVSHKIILPLSPVILRTLREPLRPLGPVVSNTIAGSTVFLLPGAFGFLVWELKENWKLYEQNRPRLLEPVRIGHHGETMHGLLVRGFHSGTVPKTFAKLRRSVSRGKAQASAHRAKLHEVEHALEIFATRELVGLLRASPRWLAGELSVSVVSLTANRIRIGVRCPAVSADTTMVHIEEQAGLLVASLATPGFVAALDEERRATFETALAGLYKLAGVDLVREQIEALVGAAAAYDIAQEGLVVWPTAVYETEVVYDLRGRGLLVPVVRGPIPPELPPPLDASLLVFARQEIAWEAWTEALEEREGPRPRLVAGPSLLGADFPAAPVGSG
ncbi:MAG: hypothetical protein JWP97_4210 [Labilithrix sp.]|nr:hypothetical protein [Labilithrix sp.]